MKPLKRIMTTNEILIAAWALGLLFTVALKILNIKLQVKAASMQSMRKTK